MTFMNKFKENFPFSSIVILAVGAVLLFYPATSQAVFSALIGGALLVKGGAGILKKISHSEYYSGVPFESLWNILLVGMGLFIISNKGVLISIIPYAFGLFLLISSVSSLQKSVAMRSMGYEKWASGAIFALIRIGLAAYIILNSFATGLALTRFIGACLVYDGLATAATSLGMIRARVEYDRRMDQVRDMNLSKEGPKDDGIEKVQAEFVDVVVDTIDAD